MKRLRKFEELNVFGPYQKRLAVLMMLATIPNAFSTFQFLYIHYRPDFHCDIPQEVLNEYTNLNETQEEYLLNLTVPWISNDQHELVRSKCWNYKLSENTTEGDIGIQVENQTVPCRHWRYSEDAVSVLTEFNFVCEDAWVKPFAVSLFMAGKMFGGITGGAISDRFGRRTVFLLFTVWQYFFTFLLSMSTNTTMYAILMFLCGCGTLVNYMAAALLSSEVVPSENRVRMFSFVQGGFSLGYTILPLFGYLFQNWRWFLRATNLIGLLYIPYFWLIDESPRWLASVGRDKEADAILLKIAKLNNLRIESEHKESEANICNEETNFEISTETVEEQLGVLKTLKQAARRPVLIRRMLIVCLAWFCINLLYYVIGLNSNSLSGNRFINVFLLGLLDIAATAWFYLTADKLGRRNSYISMVTMMAIFTVLTPFAGKWHPTLTNLLVCTSKLIASVGFSIILLYTGELFPTALRQSITGISNAVGKMGGITAPYVLYAGDPTGSITTSIIIGSVLLASAVLFLFLPRAINQTLPQSIEDAVNMRSEVACLGCVRKNSPSEDKT